MKNLLNSLFVAFAICLLTFVSVNDASAQSRLVDTEPLNQRSPIIKTLQKTSTTNTFGQLDYSQAVLATYEGGEQAVLTPIESKETDVVRTQVSILDAKGTISKELVLEMAPDINNVSFDGSFNGELSFYSLNGDRIFGGQYANSNLVKSLSTTATAKTNWGCVATCLKKLYSSSLGSWCKKQCLKCFAAPGWWRCGKCAACIIGGVIYCVKTC